MKTTPQSHMITIYLRNQPDELILYLYLGKPWTADIELENYFKVKTVETNDLQEAWNLTQNCFPRSTSIGDLLETKDGEFYLVTPKGFQPIKVKSETAIITISCEKSNKLETQEYKNS